MQNELEMLQAELQKRQELESLQNELNMREPPKSTTQKVVEGINYIGDSAGRGVRRAISAPSENLINPLFDAATGKDTTGSLKRANQRAEEQYFNKYPDQGIAGQTVSNLYEMLPAALGAGGLSNLTKVPEIATAAAQGMSKIPAGLTKLSGLVGKGVLTGAASAPFVYDESGQSANQRLGQGASMGGLLGAAGVGVGAGYNQLRKYLNPLVDAKGLATPQEIQSVRQAAGDMPQFAGDVINDPGLQKLESRSLAANPLSGAAKTYTEINRQLNNKSGDIINQLQEGKDVSNVAQTVSDKMKDTYKGILKQSSGNYKSATDLAEKNELQFIPKKSANKANEIIDTMQEVFKRRPNTSSDYGQFLDRVKDFSSSTPISFKQAMEDRKLINRAFGMAEGKGAMPISKEEKSKLKSLLDAYDEDLLESSKAVPKVHDQFKNATNFYKENVVPFEGNKTPQQRLMRRHVSKGTANPDRIISDFINSGKVDDAETLGALTKYLNPDEKQQLFYGFLKQQTNNDFTPNKLVSAYKKLGSNQRDVLFTDNPELRKQMDDLELLVKNNKGALSFKENPNTGIGLLPMIDYMTKGGAKALINAPKGLTDIIRTKYLTSPQALDEYLARMRGEKIDKKSSLGGLIPLAQNAINN